MPKLLYLFSFICLSPLHLTAAQQPERAPSARPPKHPHTHAQAAHVHDRVGGQELQPVGTPEEQEAYFNCMVQTMSSIQARVRAHRVKKFQEELGKAVITCLDEGKSGASLAGVEKTYYQKFYDQQKKLAAIQKNEKDWFISNLREEIQQRNGQVLYKSKKKKKKRNNSLENSRDQGNS
jgi:hypothetical protein